MLQMLCCSIRTFFEKKLKTKAIIFSEERSLRNTFASPNIQTTFCCEVEMNRFTFSVSRIRTPPLLQHPNPFPLPL